MYNPIRGSILIVYLGLLLQPGCAHAQQVAVAVAANFLNTAQQLARIYMDAHASQMIQISAGSTGSLFAQIVNGAPYDVFLAANRREPTRLEQQGYTVAGSRFTYARGVLVLWSADAKALHGNAEQVLRSSDYEYLAIPNPQTAPYGAAAESALKKMGLYDFVKNKLVVAENVGQSYHYAASGNAQLAFVALSQTMQSRIKGSSWLVPQDLYPPIEQQAVLLKSAQTNPAAREFYAFLQTPQAQTVVAEKGYATERRYRQSP